MGAEERAWASTPVPTLADTGVEASGRPSITAGVRRILSCAPVLRRSARVSAVVGTFLVALNQGDKLLASIEGPVSDDLLWKVPLTYCVPFFVATYGALGRSRDVENGSG